MKKLFFVVSFAVSASAAFAVQVGDSYDQVLAEKGKPVSKMELGSVLVLNYPDEKIKLKEGKVTEVNDPAGKPSPSSNSSSSIEPGRWTTDYAAALASAKADNRLVFLFFTGSDWCGWCQRFDSEILSTKEFASFAKEKLVLVKLDFPRQTPQSTAVKAQNLRLTKQYGIEGYPTVVVLNARGKQIAQLGYEEGGPKPYVRKLKKL
jgi:protein disulfide-isomerase